MKRIIIVFIIAAFALAGCGPKGPTTLTVMTHDSFQISKSDHCRV